MFTKKGKVQLDQQPISSIISAGCIVDGNFRAPDFVRIDGQVNGDVIVDSGLILGEKGVITGNVTTKEVVVYGQINGNITVQSVEIKSTGKIKGDIKTTALQVVSGGVYNGNLTMEQADAK